MRFPEPVRHGTDAKTEAQGRLDRARAQQGEKRHALEASKDTSGEHAAALDLEVAKERTAAQEAWLSWAEAAA